MGTSGSPQRTLAETLGVFTRRETAGTPLTTDEVADALDCEPAAVAGHLEELADRGELRSKPVGSDGRVWWRPAEDPDDGGTDSAAPLGDAQFHELVGAVTDYAIFALDAEGRVRTWNDGARRIKGYDRDEIVGEHFSTFYTQAERDAGVPEENLAGARRNGRVEDEGWRVRKDGTRFWANVTITALRDDDGDLRGYLKVTRDMTERREYEQRLREQKERFETLVREVKDYAIFLLDADGVVQTWNDGARRLKGYDEDEIVGRHFSAFYTDEDREAGRPERNLATAAAEGRVEDEGLRVRKDGTTFWANVIITALYDDDGDVRGFAKVTRDMTERHEYEQRLREQRDELDELDQINAVIRDIDQALVSATTREEIEQAVCDRLAASDTYSAAWTAEYTEGYTDITPRAWAGVGEDYLEAIRRADAADETEKGVGTTALRTGTVQPVQRLGGDLAGEPWREASVAAGYESAVTVPLVHDGVEYGVLTVYAESESAFDGRKIAVLSELGETISHAIAAIRRKERERTLTALQKSTRELLQTATVGEISDIIVETLTDDIALDDAVVYALDDSADALAPASSSVSSGADPDERSPIPAGSDSPVWASFADGETRYVSSGLPATGSHPAMVVPLGDHGALVVGAADAETFDGKMQHLVELVAATTEAALERTDRERRLQRQNDRLDSFASMLAHELRNPVQIGQIYGQQLSGGQNAEAVEYVTEAFDRIERMIDIMLVLTRGRKAVGEPTPTPLAAAAREVWADVDAPDAALDVDIDRTIRTDETYVRHLFRNLFENAVEHGGRDVTVTVGELPIGFYVADDGAGIPEADRERVFEEGYTTAADQGGTGLGLAFVAELADVYDWEVSVTESESGGARFEFTRVHRESGR
ncbi:PAS domain S-box protein [Halorussus sp. AFM4]|uniref:PAS domain S-box protein n=1 Tax=Halorussus sp. AFM4 TaxID=3421651 RepID=UPI003EC026DE